jgi:uncharacterized SAM-binding protein YcdF (DUF218 family)
MNLTQLASVALLPPFSLLLLLACGLLILRRRPRLGRSLILLATSTLYLLSTSWVAGMLQNSLEISAPIDLAQLKTADAIVVLAGGTYYDAAEYGGDTPNATSLERLRYAVRLHRASGLPILVTGGIPGGGTLAEGRVLQRVLQDEYDIAPRWVEDAARTTSGNARLSAPLLQESGVRRIALVSHAWHLRRAVPLFQSQGLDVIPAGTRFSGTRIGSPVDLLPTPAGLRDSSFALHEWLGILWYKLRTIIT